MRQLKEDFDFLIEISREFFLREEIVIKLQSFTTCNIKGWEIWLQVEFAIFLYAHSKVAEIKREQRFGLDKRKSKNKDICSIDFLIRQKYKQSAIPLEIKQHINASDCIRHMINDINKYEKIKNSSVTTGRSLWCLGVHRTVEDEYLNKLIKENKFREFHPDLVKSLVVTGTDYTFTLF